MTQPERKSASAEVPANMRDDDGMHFETSRFNPSANRPQRKWSLSEFIQSLLPDTERADDLKRLHELQTFARARELKELEKYELRDLEEKYPDE